MLNTGPTQGVCYKQPIYMPQFAMTQLNYSSDVQQFSERGDLVRQKQSLLIQASTTMCYYVSHDLL